MKLFKKSLLIIYVLALFCNVTLPLISRQAAAETNLIANSSLETTDPSNSSLPQGWAQGGWGTNSRTYSYANTGHTGSKSAQVQITSYTSGDTKWFFTPVVVTPGTTYTFSDYYKSTVASDIVAQIEDASGNLTYQGLGSAPIASNWQQYQATLVAPASAKKVTLFHLIAAVGSLTIDDASLTAPTTPPVTPPGGGTVPVDPSNLVPNPSLETADGTLPLGWYPGSWGSNTANLSYNTVGRTGNRSVKITMSNFVDGGANWTYNPAAVQAGKVYEFSSYYQSNAATQVLVAVKMSNGTTQYLWLGNLYTSDGAWTRFYKTFTMPAGAVSAVAYQSISGNGYFMADDFSLKPYVAQSFSTPLVSITFDDGIATQYKNALPILQTNGMAATFYIVSGNLGVCDPNISSICYMTTKQVQNLYKAGQEIGSHTVSHPALTSLTMDQLTHELADSQASLKQLTGVPVTNFAAPYGAVNLSVLTQGQKYYTSQRGVEIGYNDKNNYNQQNLLIQDINSTTTVAQVKSYIDYAKSTNTWLILMYHDINTDGTIDPGYNTTPADFRKQMTYLKASGVPVKTITQALQTIAPQLNK